MVNKVSRYTLNIPSDIWNKFLNTFPRSITIQNRLYQIIEKEIKSFQDNGGKFNA